MKIALFTTEILTKHNAASLYVNEPLKHLAKFKDLEIHLIAPNDIPTELKNFNSIKQIRYTLYEKPLFKLISTFSVISKLIDEDYDVFHCIGEKAVCIALIAQKIKRKKTPILYEGFEVVGCLEMEIETMKGMRLLKYKILDYALKFRKDMVLKHAHAMTVREEPQKDYIMKNNIFNGKIFVIGTIGVNLDLFGKNYKKDIGLINNLGLINKKVIMYTGEIGWCYGVHDLIKAMVIINSEIKDVALVIVGDGRWLSAAKECAKKEQLNNVIFIGRVPHTQIPNYHSIADVLVIPHPKRIDSELQFPTKLLEYLASGKPIVSSNLKATADVVRGTAVLVEPGNPQSFAEGIIKLLNNERLAKKMGEGGKKLIYNYSWEKTAEKLYEAYKFMSEQKEFNERDILS